MTKNKIDTTESDDAGLTRFLQVSAGLTEALQRNVDLVIEPQLKRKLQDSLERLKLRGRCHLPQKRTKAA
jgi:hypothetical protein